MITNKYLVKTAEEVSALAGLFQGGASPLPSIGGKTLKDIYGYDKTYNVDYFYSVGDLGEKEINNPYHPSVGKYYVPVSSVDVETHAPSEVANLLDKDPSWRLEE